MSGMQDLGKFSTGYEVLREYNRIRDEQERLPVKLNRYNVNKAFELWRNDRSGAVSKAVDTVKATHQARYEKRYEEYVGKEVEDEFSAKKVPKYGVYALEFLNSEAGKAVTDKRKKHIAAINYAKEKFAQDAMGDFLDRVGCASVAVKEGVMVPVKAFTGYVAKSLGGIPGVGNKIKELIEDKMGIKSDPNTYKNSMLMAFDDSRGIILNPNYLKGTASVDSAIDCFLDMFITSPVSIMLKTSAMTGLASGVFGAIPIFGPMISIYSYISSSGATIGVCMDVASHGIQFLGKFVVNGCYDPSEAAMQLRQEFEKTIEEAKQNLQAEWSAGTEPESKADSKRNSAYDASGFELDGEHDRSLSRQDSDKSQDPSLGQENQVQVARQVELPQELLQAVQALQNAQPIPCGQEVRLEQSRRGPNSVIKSNGPSLLV